MEDVSNFIDEFADNALKEAVEELLLQFKGDIEKCGGSIGIEIDETKKVRLQFTNIPDELIARISEAISKYNNI